MKLSQRANMLRLLFLSVTCKILMLTLDKLMLGGVSNFSLSVWTTLVFMEHPNNNKFNIFSIFL